MASMEVGRGIDSARVVKYDGLPSEGKRIIDPVRPVRVSSVLPDFASTMSPRGAVVSDPLVGIGSRPKFSLRIPIVDSHSEDSF